MVSKGLRATKEVVVVAGERPKVDARLPLMEDPAQVDDKPPLALRGVADTPALLLLLPMSFIREREAVAGMGGGLKALLIAAISPPPPPLPAFPPPPLPPLPRVLGREEDREMVGGREGAPPPKGGFSL